MKKALIIIIIFLLLFTFGCNDNQGVNTSKNIYHDDIADLTFLNGCFFSTNFDLSFNAGSQLDLLKFEMDADHIYISDHFDLEMNGQGYFALTNDGSDLYLQSRNFQYIIKCSPIGEKLFLEMDSLTIDWQACGVAYQNTIDSLVALYRNIYLLNQYRIRTISKNLTFTINRDEIFLLDSAINGVYAIAYNDPLLYMLGVDSSLTNVLMTMDENLNITTIETITDSTVTGLCFKENDLYLSYKDRRIEKWDSN